MDNIYIRTQSSHAQQLPCISRQRNLTQPAIYIAIGHVYYPITQAPIHHSDFIICLHIRSTGPSTSEWDTMCSKHISSPSSHFSTSDRLRHSSHPHTLLTFRCRQSVDSFGLVFSLPRSSHPSITFVFFTCFQPLLSFSARHHPIPPFSLV
jgi:hypothetical protein